MPHADQSPAARRVATIFDRWSRADHIRLHAGEMTTQEMRSVRAVVGVVRREVEAAITLADAEAAEMHKTAERAWYLLDLRADEQDTAGRMAAGELRAALDSGMLHGCGTPGPSTIAWRGP